MKLEDYFDFLSPDDVRIKGHRIGIESILYDYLDRHRSPEQIARRFPTLGLDQIYATILYYLRNKEKLDGYMQDWKEFGESLRAEQARNPSPVVARLIKLQAARDASLTRTSILD